VDLAAYVYFFPLTGGRSRRRREKERESQPEGQEFGPQRIFACRLHFFPSLSDRSWPQIIVILANKNSTSNQFHAEAEIIRCFRLDSIKSALDDST
jgi:hypothetical protein